MIKKNMLAIPFFYHFKSRRLWEIRHDHGFLYSKMRKIQLI